MNQHYTSACTSINSRRAPAVYGMKKAVQAMTGKRVIDIGGGKYDTAIEAARAYNCNVSIYDRYNRTQAHNEKALAGEYDVAVISNVLNVIDTIEARRAVVLLAAEKAGTILITVYEGTGTGTGAAHGDAWQENRKTETYTDEVSAALGAGWIVARFGKLIEANRR